MTNICSTICPLLIRLWRCSGYNSSFLLRRWALGCCCATFVVLVLCAWFTIPAPVHHCLARLCSQVSGSLTSLAHLFIIIYWFRMSTASITSVIVLCLPLTVVLRVEVCRYGVCLVLLLTSTWCCLILIPVHLKLLTFECLIRAIRILSRRKHLSGPIFVRLNNANFHAQAWLFWIQFFIRMLNRTRLNRRLVIIWVKVLSWTD